MDAGVRVWMARIMKKYVVEPAEMWWPSTLGLSLSSRKLIIFSTIFTFLIHLLSQFYFINSILYSIILIPQFQLFYNLNLQLIVN